MRKRSARPKDEIRCSFCFRLQDVVEQLISSPKKVGRKQSYICDECVTVAIGILKEKKKEKEESQKRRVKKST